MLVHATSVFSWMKKLPPVGMQLVLCSYKYPVLSDASSLPAIARSDCLESGWKIEAGNLGNGNCGSKRHSWVGSTVGPNALAVCVRFQTQLHSTHSAWHLNLWIWSKMIRLEGSEVTKMNMLRPPSCSVELLVGASCLPLWELLIRTTNPRWPILPSDLSHDRIYHNKK